MPEAKTNKNATLPANSNRRCKRVLQTDIANGMENRRRPELIMRADCCRLSWPDPEPIWNSTCLHCATGGCSGELTLSDGARSLGFSVANDGKIDTGVISFTTLRIRDSWSGATARAAAMMEARAYGSDWMAAFTISAAAAGEAATAALMI